MKNLWLLPTDKPSRLWLTSDNKLELNPKITDIDILLDNQNIYITSDEKIKEGDKILNPTNEVQTCIGLEKGIGTDNICWVKVKETTTLQQILNSQKIILTTDQDLINDGVQAIDDEFLEWFVKNPSCEKVEIESYTIDKEWDKVHTQFNSIYPQKTKYKIIIPKEEPKTNLEKLPFPELVKEFAEYYKNVPLVEEPKQEILEEVDTSWQVMSNRLTPKKQ